jgi:hypothetical protein
MKKEFLKALLVIAGAVLFNIIFWQEKLAINALLFDGFVLWSVFFLYPFSFSNATVKWLLLAHVITLVTVIIHNTELSKLAFSITLLLVVAFVQYVHRSVWYAALSTLMNFTLMLPDFLYSFKTTQVKKISGYSVSKVVRFLIIPLILLLVFFIIYSFSNDVFKDIMNDVGNAVQQFFSKLFDWFNWERLGFLLLGLFITGGLLLKSNINTFSEKDISQQNEMHRTRKSLKKWKNSAAFDVISLFMGRFANGNMALKNENAVGIISLALLNLLLLCINCIDIVYVWFGFSYKYSMNLSDYVHEGTWLLILSIVLAMSILLFFFRDNLNFYKKNKWLRYGAYGWIIQNMVLVISVLLRDHYYIAHCGLAYKRIGVLFFLAMVLAGLITMFVKIFYCKTNYYLLRINAWFAIIILVLSSCIHWDELIANYNLTRKDTIPLDVKFLLSLSDKTLPIIAQNQDVLEKEINPPNDDGTPSRITAKQIFEQRENDFFEDQKKYSWLSWNLSDEYVKKHLSPSIATLPINH